MGIRIKVYDANEQLTPCRIVIRKSGNGPVEDNGNAGEIIYCSGEHDFEAVNGEYMIEVFKGKLYAPVRHTAAVHTGNVEFRVQLKPLVDTRKLGLYSFDAHSHVSRNENLVTGNLGWASTVMMAEDFNFFYAGSPYDHETHLEYLNKEYKSDAPYREQFASDIRQINQINQEGFIIDIGNEFVKCRYGHICLFNFVQKPPFSKYYDEAWDPWNDSNRQGDEPRYEISYPYEAVLAEKQEHSFAFSAHPTSWWWGMHDVFITNIASTLAFDLLTGAVDGMVIMGYGSDKKAYQDLWFEALRNGYFIPGVAETDVSFDAVPKQRFLQYKTYAFLEEFSMQALGAAMKNGRNIVSSGPILVMRVNGQLPGAVFSYESGEAFEIAIEAYSCYEASLSTVQLIVNGDIAAEYAVSDMQYDCTHRIEVKEDSFVIAKCYDFAGNVAITSPVYIRNQPFVNKGYLSDVNVHVRKAGKPAVGVYWLDDEPGRNAFEGKVLVQMNPVSSLHISVDGEVRTVKLFELDELQRIFKHLYLGDFNRDKRYQSGEVPADAFKIARVKEILNHVELNVEF
ncbi:CehA/McbA family metallohydrolase [Paenibacillus sepulcri]|uniref:CehA/McbA family metallohydrolase n=1 Tax=Paenibacillus sepulcri TaxID=359917 RepID=A0ABS7BVS5_9BACL|nr:CehA/McbA family metallohydrolase [Paenibacillus sepulcri]